MKVLVFNDDLGLHKVFELKLKNDEVSWASTVSEAIDVLSKKSFDIVYLENTSLNQLVAQYIVALPSQFLPNQVIVGNSTDSSCEQVYMLIREANIAVIKEDPAWFEDDDF